MQSKLCFNGRNLNSDTEWVISSFKCPSLCIMYPPVAKYGEQVAKLCFKAYLELRRGCCESTIELFWGSCTNTFQLKCHFILVISEKLSGNWSQVTFCVCTTIMLVFRSCYEQLTWSYNGRLRYSCNKEAEVFVIGESVLMERVMTFGLIPLHTISELAKLITKV
jgi:hypothetical protein